MSENPYQPPELRSDPPRAGRKQRPRSPFGYVVAVVVGALLAGIIFDTAMVWSRDNNVFGMTLGALIAAALYHFLPQYEPRDD